MSVSTFSNLHGAKSGDLDLTSSGEVLKDNAGGATTTIFAEYIDNTQNSAATYSKGYDLNSAPTVGTTVPVEVTKIPAGGRLLLVKNNCVGIAMATGYAVAGVTAGGTGGTTAPTNDCKMQVWTE